MDYTKSDWNCKVICYLLTHFLITVMNIINLNIYFALYFLNWNQIKLQFMLLYLNNMSLTTTTDNIYWMVGQQQGHLTCKKLGVGGDDLTKALHVL